MNKTSQCYFCKKEFKENEDYETHGSYQVNAFKVVGGNVTMHKECLENWEKDIIPIPRELQQKNDD